MRSLSTVPKGYFGEITLPEQSCDSDGFDRWVKGLPIGYASLVLSSEPNIEFENGMFSVAHLINHFSTIPKSEIKEALNHRKEQDVHLALVQICVASFVVLFFFVANL